eukprot:5787082-Amphidinium_carterae.1
MPSQLRARWCDWHCHHRPQKVLQSSPQDPRWASQAHRPAWHAESKLRLLAKPLIPMNLHT